MSEQNRHKDILLSIIVSESATSILNRTQSHISENQCSTSSNQNRNTNYEQIFTTNLSKETVNRYKENIVSETALFSSSTASSSSSTVDNLSADYVRQNANSIHSIASLQNILRPVRVLTHPLIRIQSLINLNPLYNRDPLCRICHGGTSFEDLLTPCNCKGTIAFAHLNCLERWLSDSNRNECEICLYNFKIIRQPMYSIPRSIIVFLIHPGENLKNLLLDTFIFLLYTPTATISSFMLMSLCEHISLNNIKSRKMFISQFLAFMSILGVGTIDFTYSAWLTMTLQKYYKIWNRWYKRHCILKVILSTNKLKAGNTQVQNN